MGTDTDFSRLQQLAAKRLRFHAAVAESQDFLETYESLLYKSGYTEDDIFYQQYMLQIENAPEEAEMFCRVHPNDYLRLYFLNDLRRKYFQYDRRNSDYVIYSPEVVLLVVLWSKLCGNNTCAEHAEFWFEYNPLMQFLIPGMPAPSCMISDETIRFFLKNDPR